MKKTILVLIFNSLLLTGYKLTAPTNLINGGSNLSATARPGSTSNRSDFNNSLYYPLSVILL